PTLFRSPANPGGTGQRRNRRKHAQADGRDLRVRGTRRGGAKRLRRASGRMARTRRRRSRKPVRGFAFDRRPRPARRTRGRNSTAAPALDTGEGGRRAVRVAYGRAGYWKVAPERR